MSLAKALSLECALLEKQKVDLGPAFLHRTDVSSCPDEIEYHEHKTRGLNEEEGNRDYFGISEGLGYRMVLSLS